MGTFYLILGFVILGFIITGWELYDIQKHTAWCADLHQGAVIESPDGSKGRVVNIKESRDHPGTYQISIMDSIHGSVQDYNSKFLSRHNYCFTNDYMA